MKAYQYKGDDRWSFDKEFDTNNYVVIIGMLVSFDVSTADFFWCFGVVGKIH